MEKWGSALRLLGLGFYIIGCILGGVLLGHWLDGKLNTSPILLLVGLVLGLVAAFWGVYQMLIPFIKDNKTGRK
jgi:ATP synthase protein I